MTSPLRRPLTRIQPAAPVQAYQTYEMRRPPATHWRNAACREVGCPNADGWVTRVDEATDLGRQQAHHIRHRAGRRYRESRTPQGVTVFTFAAGQRCFRNHRRPVDRPALWVVRGGDWRRHLGVIREHKNAAHWVEDMADRLDRLATVRQRG